MLQVLIYRTCTKKQCTMAIQKKILQICLTFLLISSISAVDEEFRNVTFAAVKTKTVYYQKEVSKLCARLGIAPTVFPGNMNSQASAMALGSKYKTEYNRLLEIERAQSTSVVTDSEIGRSQTHNESSSANSSAMHTDKEMKTPSSVSLVAAATHHTNLTSASANAIPSLIAPQ